MVSSNFTPHRTEKGLFPTCTIMLTRFITLQRLDIINLNRTLNCNGIDIELDCVNMLTAHNW